MSDWPCPNPEFEYDELFGWYRACSSCGRVAWEHEQSDPLADVINDRDAMRALAPGERFRPRPPVMKP